MRNDETIARMKEDKEQIIQDIEEVRLFRWPAMTHLAGSDSVCQWLRFLRVGVSLLAVD